MTCLEVMVSKFNRNHQMYSNYRSGSLDHRIISLRYTSCLNSLSGCLPSFNFNQYLNILMSSCSDFGFNSVLSSQNETTSYIALHITIIKGQEHTLLVLLAPFLSHRCADLSIPDSRTFEAIHRRIPSN
jgi:hypothetical protein